MLLSTGKLSPRRYVLVHKVLFPWHSGATVVVVVVVLGEGKLSYIALPEASYERDIVSSMSYELCTILWCPTLNVGLAMLGCMLDLLLGLLLSLDLPDAGAFRQLPPPLAPPLGLAPLLEMAVQHSGV